MKKLILTIALALGISMPISGISDARIGSYVPEEWKGIWLIKNNNTPLYLIVAGGFGEPEVEEEICKLNRGAKVVVTHWGDESISVSTVPRSRCEGYIRARHIHDVAYRPDASPPPTHEVFTDGRWGNNEVPVFRTRSSYYSARFSMDREGHYNLLLASVACRLPVGTAVDFKPFRDWGVGEVKAGNCSGWVDRGVIR